jgi:hypothetical protein
MSGGVEGLVDVRLGHGVAEVEQQLPVLVARDAGHDLVDDLDAAC